MNFGFLDFCVSSSVSCQGEDCQLKDVQLDVKKTPPSPMGTCLIMGDPHYSTFDGSYYSFMGNCTYIVAKNCHIDDEHPQFQINTKNERNGNKQNTLVSVVTILVYGNTITFNRREVGLIMVCHEFEKSIQAEFLNERNCSIQAIFIL